MKIVISKKKETGIGGMKVTTSKKAVTKIKVQKV